METSLERFRGHFFRRITAEDIDREAVRRLADSAAREDLEEWGFRDAGGPAGDATAACFARPEDPASASLVAREPLVPAGLPFVPILLEVFDPDLRFEPQAVDGAMTDGGRPLGRISGPQGSLFTAERTVLNFLQFLSGIATTTTRLVRLLGDSPTRLLDTRKTPPGYRALAKYAFAAGGGWNHRLGLRDRIMLKDNHLGAIGLRDANGFREAVARARTSRPDLPVQIEVDRPEQLPAALAAEPEALLFDNFSTADLREAVAFVDGRCLTEASGGVTEDTLPGLGLLGLDFVSTGAAVHRARWTDIGLDLD